MKALEPLILVRELPPACSRQRQYLPSLRELVSVTPHPDETKILFYLSQGVDCGIYNDPGMLYDVLQPGKRIDFALVQESGDERLKLHPHLMMTDGAWVWPGAVLYYIAVYHLQLPEQFLHHAEKSQWKIDPDSIDKEKLCWDAFDGIPIAEAKVR